MQIRAADSVAAFVNLCNSPLWTGKNNPSGKVIKNILVFLCRDTRVTPVFGAPQNEVDGIITLNEEKSAVTQKKAAGGAKDAEEESDQQLMMRLNQRGALATFKALAKRFGGSLFEQVPQFWLGISSALLETFPEGGYEGWHKSLADLQVSASMRSMASSRRIFRLARH